MSPVDPAAAASLTPPERQAQRFSDLERRVKALEAGSPTIQQSEGAPTAAVRDGTAVVDKNTTRLWLRINGGWCYVVLIAAGS